MGDLKSYIDEALRVRRAIQVFTEFFGSEEAVEILTNASLEVSFILKRSMHDEILISLSRLFDSDYYKRKGNKYEYLSQRNLLEKYQSSVKPEIQLLREETTALWDEVSVKLYRDLKVAHNDKDLLIGKKDKVTHKLTFEKAANLVETSISLMIKLQSSVSSKDDVSLYKKVNEVYAGKGKSFINKLKHNNAKQ